MLSDVTELEHDGTLASLEEGCHMLLLLDFKAAFPSVEHDIMKECLKAMGLPQVVLNVINSLHDEGRRCIGQDGYRHVL